MNLTKTSKEALPEFERYMPSEPAERSKNLPALANIVADFKSAGLKFEVKND